MDTLDGAHPAGEDLSAYVDGELDRRAVAAVQRHVAACAECRTSLVAYRQIGALVRGLPAASTPVAAPVAFSNVAPVAPARSRWAVWQGAV